MHGRKQHRRPIRRIVSIALAVGVLAAIAILALVSGKADSRGHGRDDSRSSRGDYWSIPAPRFDWFSRSDDHRSDSDHRPDNSWHWPHDRDADEPDATPTPAPTPTPTPRPSPRVQAVAWYDFDLDGVGEAGSSANEVLLDGWLVNVTDPSGTITGHSTPVVIDPAGEGEYTLCAASPQQTGWVASTPLCQIVTVAQGDDVVVEFGVAYYAPFAGGQNVGYWWSRTGLHGTPRDAAYDSLPIVLGVETNGIAPPEVFVHGVATAETVFTGASGSACSGNCLPQLKAYLLAAKLNVLKYPGFGNATLDVLGPTVQSIVDAADQLLDSVARGAISGDLTIKAVAEPLKNKLDRIDNNLAAPSLYAIGASPGPYAF